MKTLLTPAEAEARIFSLREPFPAMRCPLDLAAGRVLRQAIAADDDFPPFDRVMMDGIAVRFSEIEAGARRFHIRGMAAAGDAATALPQKKECAIEVMTGAMLPVGTDCILPCEWFREENGIAEIADDIQPKPDVFIHKRGSDHRAGDTLVQAGVKLGPVEISIAAACGCAELEVSRHIRIAVIGTGDELVPIDAQPRHGQIRQTNIAALSAALLLAGHPALERGHLRDEPEVLSDALAEVFARNDVVVLTGGVSKGRRDHVPEVVAKLGGDCVLHGIAQRPGKPMAVWTVAGGPVVVGLPGNPVSALVCLHRYILPALNRWCGALVDQPSTRRVEGNVAVAQGLTLFLPVTDDRGGVVRPSPVANSGDFAGLAGSAGFVELDEKFATGATAPYFPWAAK